MTWTVRRARGFSLLETMVAMILVAIAMTGLVVAFVGSSKYGVLSRRQAAAVSLARSLAGQLNHVAYADARLANTNTSNDTTFADPNGVFAQATVPTSGPNVPDYTIGNVNVGNEVYTAYVNVSPVTETTLGFTYLDGVNFAVIVRYSVQGQFMRAVALGFRYCPVVLTAGNSPL